MLISGIQRSHEDEWDVSPLHCGTTPFIHKNTVRHLFQHKQNLAPSIALAMYEQFLVSRGSSHNTVKAEFKHLNYLFTWASIVGVDLDSIFLSGQQLEPRQIRAFAHWLDKRGSLKCKIEEVKPLDTGYRNSIVTTCSSVSRWFVDQYGRFEGDATTRSVHRELAEQSLKKTWTSVKKKWRNVRIAPDLSDEEIHAINETLKPENRVQRGVPIAQATRDFLMWRIVIEFGIRIGEMLSLTLDDCPSRNQDYLQVVRVEERHNGFRDPRGSYAPRPKTLSRNLGFILKGSPIPRLISDYTSKHRRVKVKKHGRRVWQPILSHPFLILNDRDGSPLSMTGAQRLVRKIALESKVRRLHWHLVRHTFFNRAFTAVSENDDYKDRIMDLIHYGGWQDPASIEIYIRRARKHRAERGLILWQTGGNEWEALK